MVGQQYQYILQYIIIIRYRSNVGRNIRSDKYPKSLPLRYSTNSNNHHRPLPKPHKNPFPHPNILHAHNVPLHQAPLPIKKHIPLLRILAQ